MLDQIAANAVGAVFVVNISRLVTGANRLEHLRLVARSQHVDSSIMDGSYQLTRADPNDIIFSANHSEYAQFENKKRTEHMSTCENRKSQEWRRGFRIAGRLDKGRRWQIRLRSRGQRRDPGDHRYILPGPFDPTNRERTRQRSASKYPSGTRQS